MSNNKLSFCVWIQVRTHSVCFPNKWDQWLRVHETCVRMDCCHFRLAIQLRTKTTLPKDSSEQQFIINNIIYTLHKYTVLQYSSEHLCILSGKRIKFFDLCRLGRQDDWLIYRVSRLSDVKILAFLGQSDFTGEFSSQSSIQRLQWTAFNILRYTEITMTNKKRSGLQLRPSFLINASYTANTEEQTAFSARQR